MVDFIELTRSKLRRKLLGYFFTNPESKLYLREIAFIIKSDPANLSRELSRLERYGIFSSQRRGNQKYFSLNKNNPIFNELKSIVFKTVGIKGSLQKLLEEIEKVKIAFIYGSYAKSTENLHSDVDLFIIGDATLEELYGAILRVQKQVDREINPTTYTVKELKEKYKAKHHFILSVLKGPKLFLKGDKDALRKLVEGR